MTLNAQASRQARDAGIAQVQLGRKEWMESAMRHADVYLRQNRHRQLMMEDVSEGIRSRLPEPESENIWGAVAQKLTRQKKWKPVGSGTAKKVSARSRLTRVYKVTI